MGREIGSNLGLSSIQLQQTAVQQQLSLLERLAKIHTESLDEAAKYSKVIVGLGFAGFLTVWSGARELLGPTQKAVTAFLLTFSLFWYIAFEVGQMIYMQYMRFWFNKELAKKPNNAHSVLADYDAKMKKAVPVLSLCWFVVLVMTVIPGFSGALVLAYSFAMRILAGH